MVPCCLPIRAMSLLKSPNRMMLLKGLLWMWLNMVVCIMDMTVMSSMCVGMYKYIKKYVGSGELVILIICRYGKMFVVKGILVILPENV